MDCPRRHVRGAGTEGAMGFIGCGHPRKELTSWRCDSLWLPGDSTPSNRAAHTSSKGPLGSAHLTWLIAVASGLSSRLPHLLPCPHRRTHTENLFSTGTLSAPLERRIRSGHFSALSPPVASLLTHWERQVLTNECERPVPALVSATVLLTASLPGSQAPPGS